MLEMLCDALPLPQVIKASVITLHPLQRGWLEWLNPSEMSVLQVSL